jgi:hypothetical protein
MSWGSYGCVVRYFQPVRAGDHCKIPAKLPAICQPTSPTVLGHTCVRRGFAAALLAASDTPGGTARLPALAVVSASFKRAAVMTREFRGPGTRGAAVAWLKGVLQVVAA